MCTGCVTLGIKEQSNIVMVSPMPIPEAAKGAVMIRTNRKIPLTILNRPELNFEQNVGGYILVDPWFYDRLLQAYRRSRGTNTDDN